MGYVCGLVIDILGLRGYSQIYPRPVLSHDYAANPERPLRHENRLELVQVPRIYKSVGVPQ